MESFFELLKVNAYMTYSIAVVLFTAGLRYSLFDGINLGPKWVTLIVGVCLGVVMFFMNWIDLEGPTEFFTLFAALGASSALYDYVLKFVLDLINRRNPFKENKE